MQIGGLNQPLPFPGATFPLVTLATGVTFALNSNAFNLPAGGIIQVPPGIWYIDPGLYGWVQLLDPVTGLYRTDGATPGKRGIQIVNSDGSNYRVWNPLGLPVGALVTDVGSGYVQSSTTVTAGGSGGSTWRAIVGGAVTSVTVGNDPLGNAGGTNWTYAPTVVISAPPAGGVAATGYAALSSGAIASITMDNEGAGYVAVPSVLLIPNPLDPNLSSATPITYPALTAVLGGSGEITAVLPVLPGTPLTSAPTLTVHGVGSSATASAIMALTVTALTVSGGSSGTPVWATGGQVLSPGSITNPAVSNGIFIPRQLNAYESGSAAGVVIDGGMFQVAPTLSPSTATPTMGSSPTLVFMQLMPGT